MEPKHRLINQRRTVAHQPDLSGISVGPYKRRTFDAGSLDESAEDPVL
jgi:hypothetical protein